MCDCSDDKKEKGRTPETIKLFPGCSKPGRFRDTQLSSSCQVTHNWSPSRFDFFKDEPLNTTIYSDKSSDISSLCSSGSSRVYKFVQSQDFDLTRGEEAEEENKEEAKSPEISEKSEIWQPSVIIREEPEKSDTECTLCIIKPEAVVDRDLIERIVLEEDFEIIDRRCLQLSPEQASEFYFHKYGEKYFPHLVAYMSSGPIIVLLLAKPNAIEDFRFLMGPAKVSEAKLYFPACIRARFGQIGEDFRNVVHGSGSSKLAENEIHFFFPDMMIEPLLRGNKAIEYLWETINPILLDGLAQCAKKKPDDPLIWLANWLLENNPNKPKTERDVIPTS